MACQIIKTFEKAWKKSFINNKKIATSFYEICLLLKQAQKNNSWNVKFKKNPINDTINDVILDENLPKAEEHTQQEQTVLYIYNTEMSVFPAEIELLEWCVTAFYQ